MQDRYEIRDEEDYSSRVIKPWQLLVRVSGSCGTPTKSLTQSILDTTVSLDLIFCCSYTQPCVRALMGVY